MKIFLMSFFVLGVFLWAPAQSVLTAKPWHLYQKRQGEKRSLLHKPGDETFVFTFYEGGKLLNQRYHGKTETTYTWRWEGTGNKKITLRRNSDSMGAVFYVKELSARRFTWYIADAKGKNIYEFTFRHADDTAWLKEDTDEANAARKDSLLKEKPEPKP